MSATQFRTFTVKDRQVFDLELLLQGGFAPLTGFMSEADYAGVVESMRLADGTLWPIPIVLDVPESAPFAVGERIILKDVYGHELAYLDIESRYRPDKQREVLAVYGSDDLAHPGVRYVLNQMHGTYLGGPVTPIKPPVRHDFRSYRYTPEELKARFKERGWDEVVAFQTRNPMHRVHYELVKRAHEKTGKPVLVHPVVGMTKPGDIDYLTRVRTYQVACEQYGKDFTELALLPLAMRMAGPREALWHMIVRKNFGATHFIVGRDHAGPGKNSQDEPFYEPYAARDLAEAHADEVGIGLVPSDELGYVPQRGAYASADELSADEEMEHISGTEFRRRLQAGEDIPEWFSFPESIDILRRQTAATKQPGVVIFFTGLSGAGKSTVAHILGAKLAEVSGRAPTLLDGDVLRTHLSSELGFSKEHRDLNVQRTGFVAAEVARHGGVAICSLIAPYEAARQTARQIVEEAGGTFIEVHVKTPLEVCEERDTKGLYEKARAGTITGFTGIDDPYEAPERPELSLDTTEGTPEEAAEAILTYLLENGLVVEV